MLEINDFSQDFIQKDDIFVIFVVIFWEKKGDLDPWPINSLCWRCLYHPEMVPRNRLTGNMSEKREQNHIEGWAWLMAYTLTWYLSHNSDHPSIIFTSSW